MRNLLKVMVCALLLLGGAHARAQGCGVAEGPNLKDTLDYIMNKEADLTGWSFDLPTGKLVLTANEKWRSIIDFMNTQCDVEPGVSVGGKRFAYVNCIGKIQCIERERWTLGRDYTDGWDFRDGKEANFDVFTVASGDAEMTGNLARALSHALYLLREQFRASHRQDDPFAPK